MICIISTRWFNFYLNVRPSVNKLKYLFFQSRWWFIRVSLTSTTFFSFQLKFKTHSYAFWLKIKVVTECLAAEHGLKLNRRNAPKSKIFTQLPPKGSFKLLKSIRCLLRNVKGFKKLVWFFSEQILRACRHYNIARQPSNIVVCTSLES